LISKQAKNVELLTLSLISSKTDLWMNNFGGWCGFVFLAHIFSSVSIQ